MRLAQGDVWWQVLSGLVGGLFLFGLVAGSVRAFVRGFREGPERRGEEPRS